MCRPNVFKTNKLNTSNQILWKQSKKLSIKFKSSIGEFRINKWTVHQIKAGPELWKELTNNTLEQMTLDSLDMMEPCRHQVFKQVISPVKRGSCLGPHVGCHTCILWCQALTLKGIRNSSLWSQFEWPWDRKQDILYHKFHGPIWRQFHEVFLVLQNEEPIKQGKMNKQWLFRELKLIKDKVIHLSLHILLIPQVCGKSKDQRPKSWPN